MENSTGIEISDLKNSLEGRVYSDPVTRAVYSSGACLYRIVPQVVVQPKTKDDVLTSLSWATENGLPIVARGGGTSRCGNELGSGLVLDFTRYMNQILEVDPRNLKARIQPGLVLGDLNRSLKEYGLYFPIDPSTGEWCTLGGMIANNSSGPHAVKYGTIRDWVTSLKLALANGLQVRTGPKNNSECHLKPIYDDLLNLIKANYEALETDRPDVVKNSAGYHLWRLADALGNDQEMDLTPLLVGSEGTLALTLEADLNLARLPRAAVMGLFSFDDLAKVGPAVLEILETKPSMVEIIERHILDLARESSPLAGQYLEPGIEAILLVEFQGEEEAELRASFEDLGRRLVNRLATGLRLAEDKSEMAALARMRSIAGPILNKVRGREKPVAFIEDAAVHPRHLPVYIQGLRDIFKRFEVEAGIYGHAGDGELHNMVFLDLTRPDQVEKMEAISEAVYDLVLGLKGTISGEHGDGRLRTDFLKRQYPNLFPIMAEVKRIFDPGKLLNPGVIIPTEGKIQGLDLKFGPEYEPQVLDHINGLEEMEACSGCGKCRSYCPVAKAIPEEWALGRAKTTLLREIMAGRLEPEQLGSARFKEVMKACLNCGRCLTECPSGVDLPWLVIEARSEINDRFGSDPVDRRLSRTRQMLKLGGMFPGLANLTAGSGPLRALLEAFSGLDRNREIPVPAGRDLLRMVDPGNEPNAQQVVYFPGCYALHNKPEEIGLALISIVKRLGYQPDIPDLRCCGMAALTNGLAQTARGDLEHNLGRLAPYARTRVPILFSEPSCAMAVKDEYPRLAPPELAQVAQKVSDCCSDLGSFLIQPDHLSGLMESMADLNLRIAYHQPCHLRGNENYFELLRSIPGLEVIRLPDICCGMGGTFGLKKANFDLSMEIGSSLFSTIREVKISLVSTPCSACAMQISQGSGMDTCHPLELIEQALDSSKS